MNKVDLINLLLAKTDGNHYLEIGVEYGTSFLRVSAKNKLAVDPRFRLLGLIKFMSKFTAGDCQFFGCTSDEFFAKQAGYLKCNPIDLAFVDGLHTFEQSLRDVENCLKYLSDGGFVIVHDCNPRSGEAARVADSHHNASRLRWGKFVPKIAVPWTGDVWKTIVYLRSKRNDVDVSVLDYDHGLGVIRKGRPKDRLSLGDKEIELMTYNDLEMNRTKLLNLKQVPAEDLSFES